MFAFSLYIGALCTARSGARIKIAAKVRKKNDIHKSICHFFVFLCILETHFHADVGEVGFGEGCGGGAIGEGGRTEAEVGVEGSGLGLGMEAEGGGALTTGFGDEDVHQVTAIPLIPLGG